MYSWDSQHDRPIPTSCKILWTKLGWRVKITDDSDDKNLAHTAYDWFASRDAMVVVGAPGA